MIFVADTHSFLWHLSEDSRLGRKAKSIFELAEKGEATIAVPTIVLAESLHILEKKKYAIKFKSIMARIESGWNYLPVPLDTRIIRRIESLKKLEDLHDRIIVASALLMGAELVTRDEKIKNSKYVKVIW